MGDVALGRIESRLAADDVSMKEFVAVRDLAQQRTRSFHHDREEDEPIKEKYWPDVLEMNFKYLNDRDGPRGFLLFCATPLVLLS
jgi:hypothetical protein